MRRPATPSCSTTTPPSLSTTVMWRGWWTTRQARLRPSSHGTAQPASLPACPAHSPALCSQMCCRAEWPPPPCFAPPAAGPAGRDAGAQAAGGQVFVCIPEQAAGAGAAGGRLAPARRRPPFELVLPAVADLVLRTYPPLSLHRRLARSDNAWAPAVHPCNTVTHRRTSRPDRDRRQHPPPPLQASCCLLLGLGKDANAAS